MARVLLVSGQSLFSSALQSLLSHRAEIEIVGQEAEPTRLLERVKELQPDVVIVDRNSPAGDPADLALALFRAGVKVRVIGLGLEDNAICVYRKEKRIVRGADDLMKSIKSNVSEDQETQTHFSRGA